MPQTQTQATQKQEREAEIMIGKYKYAASVSDEYITIERIYYPIWPYGNHVTYVIEIHKPSRELEEYTVRSNWDGTGRDDGGYVYLSDDELQKIETYVHELIDKIENKDYKGVEKMYKKITKYVHMMSKRREEMIEKAFDELMEAMQRLVDDDKLLQFLKSEEAREKVREWIEEYVYS